MLRSLQRLFDENESILRFYARSLLVVYEGDLSETNGSDSVIVTLKMIDVGRVRLRTDNDKSSVDQGYRKVYECFTIYWRICGKKTRSAIETEEWNIIALCRC